MPNPEELDPTTARLVSELAASMLPTLSKSLNSAVHTQDFLNALDRTNMVSQDLRNQIEKALRSNFEEGRASRTMIIQSMRTVVDEIMSLKKLMDKVPDTLDAALKNNKLEDNNNAIILQELARISELINELIQGIRNISELYASDKTKNNENIQNFSAIDDSQILSENNTRLDKLINSSLPGLEGLVKAHEKSQSHELEEFSREISTLHEQNNLALIHDVKETVSQELESFGEQIESQLGSEHRENKALLLKILVGTSGACALFSFLTFLMMLLR